MAPGPEQHPARAAGITMAVRLLGGMSFIFQELVQASTQM
jgi:hypothetical protein